MVVIPTPGTPQSADSECYAAISSPSALSGRSRALDYPGILWEVLPRPLSHSSAVRDSSSGSEQCEVLPLVQFVILAYNNPRYSLVRSGSDNPKTIIRFRSIISDREAVLLTSTHEKYESVKMKIVLRTLYHHWATTVQAHFTQYQLLHEAKIQTPLDIEAVMKRFTADLSSLFEKESRVGWKFNPLEEFRFPRPFLNLLPRRSDESLQRAFVYKFEVLSALVENVTLLQSRIFFIFYFRVKGKHSPYWD